MASVPKPDLKALFEHYIEVYNAHQVAETLACLSPRLQVFMKEQLVLSGKNETLRKTYVDNWKLDDSRVTVERLELLEGKDEVRCVMRSWCDDQLCTILYVFEEEDGEWLQVKHVIENVVYEYSKTKETT